MAVKYKVELSDEERQYLNDLISRGKTSARKIKRAQILLRCDEACYEIQDIMDLLSVSSSTIYRTKRNFVEVGLEAALEEGSRPGQPRKLDSSQEAILVSIACSEPPKGCCRWTLSLLGEQLVTLTDIDKISIETIRQHLKNNELKPWQKKMWCLGKLDADYIARMEHILELYQEEPNEKRPIINFDEAGKQLVAQVSAPKSAKPGKVAKEDYEYKRAGMVNIFMCFDRHRGWRKVKVTENKKAIDFAHCMRDLIDVDYPHADTVRVVMDNYATHAEASLYKAFPAAEARRILNKLEFHFTPKHASWLNMAEIEIGNMNQQCLDRRIPCKDFLIQELESWQERRNIQCSSIKWMFDVDSARSKFEKAYQKINCQN